MEHIDIMLIVFGVSVFVVLVIIRLCVEFCKRESVELHRDYRVIDSD